MKIILAGGGNASQSNSVDTFFIDLLKNKNILYLPHAISPEIWSYSEAYEWLKKHDVFNNVSITMWEDISQKEINEYLQFDAIYLMGGNTFKLIDTVRSNKFDEIIEFLAQTNVVIYGISAGAIILGKDIISAYTGPAKDENLYNVTDFNGLNILNNHIVATHYIKSTDSEIIEIVKKTGSNVIGIPEDSGLHIDNSLALVLGDGDIVLFNTAGVKTIFSKGQTFKL